MEKKYLAAEDPQFQKPYIDLEEQRENYYYVHGGFEGTNVRFAFFYPPKEAYKGKFHHYTAPVPGSENAAIERFGKPNDEIGFALKNGAYYVETNYGQSEPFAPIPDATIVYRSSAAAAEFSRKVACRIYGYEHRPYGYIYGGSGGGFKCMSCFERGGAWDGAVPYVIGSPAALPNMFTVRAHAKRILRHKYAEIADAVEPGGSGDPYTCLNEEEKGALEEFLRLGFPKYDVFSLPWLDTGSLPVLLVSIAPSDPTYYSDFWSKPGYLGTDPASSVHRDRIRLRTKVTSVAIPEREDDIVVPGMSGVDDAWQKARSDLGWKGKAAILLEEAPKGDVYCEGLRLTVESGAGKGLSIPVEAFSGNAAVVGTDFQQPDLMEKLHAVKAGDAVYLDNSDYLALQTYHRHQVPRDGEVYEGFKQFVNADGTPKYPQREVWMAPGFAASGAGGLQCGEWQGKMIVIEAMMDESAFPWQADWYRSKIDRAHGGNADNDFRLYYIDKAFHGDDGLTFDDFHLVPYLGALHQALLDVSDWVEQGKEPAPSTNYRIEDGQVLVPDKDRGGIQQAVSLTVNGGKCAKITAGEEVRFALSFDLPESCGKLVKAEVSFAGEPYEALPEGQMTCSHVYPEKGTYFAAARVTVTRDGQDDPFVYVQNLDRVRIIVK